jgi:hypothetical protein
LDISEMARSIFGLIGKFDDVIFWYVHFCFGRIGNFYVVNRCVDIPLFLPDPKNFDQQTLLIDSSSFTWNAIHATNALVGTFGETDEMLAIQLDIAENQCCTSLSDRVG